MRVVRVDRFLNVSDSDFQGSRAELRSRHEMNATYDVTEKGSRGKATAPCHSDLGRAQDTGASDYRP